MPKPNEVNPSNYEVKNILFDNGEFSIVIGTWEKTEKNVLAMRWNGDNEDKGYPKTFGHPVWFIIHDELKQPIIASLMNNDSQLVSKLLER